MSERDHILISLVKEVLGPRNGSNEILPGNQNPLDEYITGVLAPARSIRPPDDIDADIDELIEEVSGEEDQDTQGDVIVPSGFSPALDPKALPRSIGLSFSLEASNGQPQIEICATWARYQAYPQGGWQRQPGGFVTGKVKADNDCAWSPIDGVSLQLRSHALSAGIWRITLFLVNSTSIPDEKKRPEVNSHLFQPQIRIHCCPGTTLVPVWSDNTKKLSNSDSDEMAREDIGLSLLYRERAAMARGHLCATVWKEIDPERPHPFLSSPNEAPFAWTDASVIPQEDRAKFSPSDVRTELVPCYPIEAPQMEWEEAFGPSPVFDPAALAETWQPSQLRESLQPLVDAYRGWIGGQRQFATKLPAADQSIVHSHLRQCDMVADRIQNAIEVLVNDEDARLAFCFANQAIITQARWAKRKIFHWRPFQLAFILLNIPALADSLHSDRQICDLLWFPTGGGKTEAYLGLAAFTLALRRRRSAPLQHGNYSGAGVGVLSRYTLRLLTIQQFRRALGIITACEMLRVQNLDSPGTPVGWRPKECLNTESFLWGGIRFSIGLWVGGGVTPNNLLSIGPIPDPPNGMTFYAGAVDILQGARKGYNGPNSTLQRSIRDSRHVEASGEPAQILTCPCCEASLAIPDEGFRSGQHTLHFVFQGGATAIQSLALFRPQSLAWLSIDNALITSHSVTGHTLSITFNIPSGKTLSARQIDDWWYQTIVPNLGQDVVLLAARPARPGYFILTYDNSQNNAHQCDFEIYCPNPICTLNQHAWAEQVPLNRGCLQAHLPGESRGLAANEQTAALPNTPNMEWQEVPECFKYGKTKWISGHLPIPAYTVDDQIYRHCPSLVIGTVDKFARLAFEPKAASLFGNVDYYHSRWGYYREGCPPATNTLPQEYQAHPAGYARGKLLHVSVPPFRPPDLILQDELHLIEGPLGSMVGLYEASVDILCQHESNRRPVIPKYVASTATIRQAEAQVQALFDRNLLLFPPSAISADDRFFSRDKEIHALECDRPGRLYVGVCAPGKGAQTPIVRIWSALLQSAYERWQLNPGKEADRFYTLTGYFNAIRELAGALSLYRQDIRERMAFRAASAARQLERHLELSSRANSLNLPLMLEQLKEEAPDAQDVVFATSMFGTGVDIDRLGLIAVHGQPKTTASYIQATGRVGRQGGGLVVTFFRASRPRDLDHYEFFTGYHRALYRHVEPITVAPFSPRARERGLGPLSVILLRQARQLNSQSVNRDWRVQQRLSGGYFAQACRMGSHRYDTEVQAIPNLLENRASHQPVGRRPPGMVTAQETESELDRWAALARQTPDHDRFVYYESALLRTPQRDVVLGDAHHRALGLGEAYENAPQSLREVEETTGFKIS